MGLGAQWDGEHSKMGECGRARGQRGGGRWGAARWGMQQGGGGAPRGVALSLRITALYVRLRCRRVTARVD